MQVTSDKVVAPAASSPTLLALDVGGMKCAGCVKAVENRLTQQPGVIAATVNLVTEIALVEYQPHVVSGEALAQKLTEAGFPSQLRWSTDESSDTNATVRIDFADKQRLETQRQFRQVAIAAALLILSAMGHLQHFGWVIPGLSYIGFHWGLATVALIGPGRSIIVDGWRGLRHHAPNMNTLVGIGTLTAYTASLVALLFPRLGWQCFFDEPVMLLGFILLGRALEQQARGRAAAAFQSLLALQPSLARLIVRQDKGERIEGEGYLELTSNAIYPSSFIPYPSSHASVEIPVHQVKVGEWLQVLSGDKIPVDGEVIAGQTTVDESMLTGEAMPLLKQPGDLVVAGSLNQSGAIAIKATRTGKDTALAQIIALVEAAQTRKAPIQKLTDTIAGYFAYGVMAIALLTFLFWYFIGIPLWSDSLIVSDQWSLLSDHTPHSPYSPPLSPLLLSLKLAIAVLVIACPCALGLATPTAILVGSGIGAERGLLIKGGDVLEKVHRLQTVVFDKTGTLTTGHPTMTDCLTLQAGLSVNSLLQLAATVESGTRHPLAAAIRARAQQEEVSPLAAKNFQTQSGYGVAAEVKGQQVILGNQLWLSQHGVSIDHAAQERAQSLMAQGKAIIYVAVAGELSGLIAVQDILRPDAQVTVERLRRMGLRVMLITGDQPSAATAVAQALHLSSADVLANVRPEDKVKAIAALQSQGQRVAMVGDGINDAPALAQADVSISLQGATDVAIEAAEIILMRERLVDVVESIRLSQAIFNKIRQNLFWAFVYNVLGIPIAAGIFLPSLGIALSPATAGAFMAFSSVSVVVNSLVLRHTFSSDT